jgi:transcriptional regulator with XRE-family HTH domain
MESFVNYNLSQMTGTDWNPMPFATWVRTQQRRREWNDADLARRLGVNSGIVSNWLSGKRRPNPRSCDLLADVFGADLDFVLNLVGHRPLTEPLPIDDPVVEITSLVRRIKPDPNRINGLAALLRTWLEMDRAS